MIARNAMLINKACFFVPLPMAKKLEIASTVHKIKVAALGTSDMIPYIIGNPKTGKARNDKSHAATMLLSQDKLHVLPAIRVAR